VTARARTPAPTAAAPTPAAPAPQPAALRLQRAAGNHAVGALVRAKLELGGTHDPEEHEADRAAEAVTAGKTCACGTAGAGTCETCRGSGAVRRSATGAAGAGAAPPAVHAALAGPGVPLSAALRADMGARFGHDFSGVRVHTDAAAADSARTIGARAYAAGADVVFAAGQFAPDTADGRHLLAHELAHVVQQAGAAPAVRRDPGDGGVPPAPTDDRDAGVPEAVVADPVAGVVPASQVPPSDPISQIRDILAHPGLFEFYDNNRIEDLWNSFGAALPEVAVRELELFNRCVARGMDVLDLTALWPVQEKFKADVKQLAFDHMFANRELIGAELARFDTGEEPGPMTPGPMSDDQRAEVEAVQIAAGEIDRAKQYQEELRRVAVGYNNYWETDDYGQGEEINDPLYFSPGGPPKAPTRGLLLRGDRPWDEVKKNYDSTQSAINGLSRQYPAAGALSTLDRQGDVGGDVSPEQARRVIARALNKVLGNLERTVGRLSEDDLDYRDLQPLHAQLFAGAWAAPVYKDVAEAVLKDHEQTEFWIAMGLGAVGAAAFIAAEFATGGMATFFVGAGLVAGGAQAARSWESYIDLAEASKAHTDSRFNLVGEGQASAALVSALLDTVFFFIDAIGVGLKAARAGQKALTRPAAGVTRESAERGLRDMAEFETAEAAVRAGTMTEAAAARHVVAASADGQLKLTVGGFLYRCASPCRMLAERYAGVLARHPEYAQLIAKVEHDVGAAAAAVTAAEEAGRTAEAATLRREAQVVFRDAAEALDTRLYALDLELAAEAGTSAAARFEAVTTREGLERLRIQAPHPARPPAWLREADRGLWQEYTEYYEKRMLQLEQDLANPARARSKPPLSFEGYRDFLGNTRRGTVFQAAQDAALADEFGREAVYSNVGVSQSLFNEVQGDVKFVDHFIRRSENSFAGMSSKSRDFAGVLARNEGDVTRALPEVLDQVRADVQELFDKYGGWRSVRREGLAAGGEPLKVTELILNLDGSLIPKALRAEVEAAARAEGRVAAQQAATTYRNAGLTFDIRFSP